MPKHHTPYRKLYGTPMHEAAIAPAVVPMSGTNLLNELVDLYLRRRLRYCPDETPAVIKEYFVQVRRDLGPENDTWLRSVVESFVGFNLSDFREHLGNKKRLRRPQH